MPPPCPGQPGDHRSRSAVSRPDAIGVDESRVVTLILVGVGGRELGDGPGDFGRRILTTSRALRRGQPCHPRIELIPPCFTPEGASAVRAPMIGSSLTAIPHKPRLRAGWPSASPCEDEGRMPIFTAGLSSQGTEQGLSSQGTGRCRETPSDDGRLVTAGPHVDPFSARPSTDGPPWELKGTHRSCRPHCRRTGTFPGSPVPPAPAAPTGRGGPPGAPRAGQLNRAIRDSDLAAVEEGVLRLSRSRRWLSPLVFAVGALGMLFEGVKLLFTNWRLTLIQVLPAMWIWLAMIDLKAHVLHGKAFHVLDGADRDPARAGRGRGHGGEFLPERRVRVLDRPGGSRR